MANIRRLKGRWGLIGNRDEREAAHELERTARGAADRVRAADKLGEILEQDRIVLEHPKFSATTIRAMLELTKNQRWALHLAIGVLKAKG